MEAVHRNEHGKIGAELVDDLPSDGALAGTRGAGDAEHTPVSGNGQRAGTLQKVCQVQGNAWRSFQRSRAEIAASRRFRPGAGTGVGRDKACRLQKIGESRVIQGPQGIPGKKVSLVQVGEGTGHERVASADRVHDRDLRGRDARRGRRRACAGTFPAVRYHNEADSRGMPARDLILGGTVRVQPGQVLRTHLQDVDQRHPVLEPA